MIYPSDFEQKIGFSQLRKILSDRCLSALGKKHVRRMKFMTDFEEVRHALQLTAEMQALLSAGLSLPQDNMHDMTDSLLFLKVVGNCLDEKELYRLKTSLHTIALIKDFFTLTDNENNLRAPVLAAEFADLVTFPLLESCIDRLLNKYGEIADNASPVLYELRRNISSASASLSSVMRRVLDEAVKNGIVDPDTSPSMRDGRFVIPVSAARKRSIRGIVHDESASGKTSYIEPIEVVAASNRLKELQEEEKREIHRLLVCVADDIRPHIPELLICYDRLGAYDFIYAKAQVALEFDAHMPMLEPKPEIDWYGAVHPVLAMTLATRGKRVVPLDLRLDAHNRILIISGPNAGGKSVCLKTVGIIQYMLQCGMLPTMYANSHASVYKDICIDIGDEQSIENDLSTYSSHLKNMKYLLHHASPEMLLLVDEMGSGTEPQIGGALAQAIVDSLNNYKAMGVITTHYQNLKTYADDTPGLCNGAMLYDRQHMQPLYRLAIGSPGSSFALEIAYKIGLPHKVIEDAKGIVGSDYVNMDKYLLDIARDRRYWQNKRQSIKDKEAKLEAMIRKYENQLDEVNSRKKEIIRAAKEEALEILSGTNRTVERTILEIRHAQADKERTKQLRKELEQYKRRIEDSARADAADALPRDGQRSLDSRHRKRQGKTAAVDKHSQSVIEVASYVRMTDGGAAGKVLSISGTNAEVAFGSIRMRVPLKKLMRAEAPKVDAKSQVSSVSISTHDASRARQLEFKTDIDLRGMRADEALQAVTYFLDDASQFGVGRLRILHGTGTGVLRQVIRKHLQSVPIVKSFKDEDVRLGGAGITVVDLL